MMLLQKQPHFSMALAQSPLIHTHRRHPSAPPQQVVVQPTRTPGLLSLSRPPRPQQHRPDLKPSPKPKAAQAANRSPKPAPAEQAGPLKAAAEIRGRSQGKKQQQQQQRSSSQAAPASRRRQPSPDPFRAAASPAPAPGPARTRQQPIPVRPKLGPALSRSDPVLSHMPRRRPAPHRAATQDPWDAFPVCDDTTDAGASRPATPTTTPTPTRIRTRPDLHLAADPRTPPRRTRLPEPPRTAPLSSSNPGSFPFPPSTPTPAAGASTSPKRRAAAAARAKHLSEGVLPPFPFAFPEDPTPKRSRSSERARAADALFASSVFQNSPSPEELPPPLFA
ncbi:hypothetical protein DFH09DRAFT_1410271 [Mycena vulgaris]|nr:hypothetical protein DFH09DRAFT_1410271 [Mycena vulgaris]